MSSKRDESFKNSSIFKFKELKEGEVDPEIRELARLLGDEPLDPVDTGKKQTGINDDAAAKKFQEETDALLEKVKFSEERADTSVSLIDSSGFRSTLPVKKTPQPYSLKFTDGETFKRSTSKLVKNNDTRLFQTENERELLDIRSKSRANFVTKMQDRNLDNVKINAQVSLFFIFIYIYIFFMDLFIRILLMNWRLRILNR